MDFATWLRRWLLRHPLKEPPAAPRATYTAEVMRQVSALHVPSLTPAPRWLAWPRLALVPLAAGAVVLILVGRSHLPGGSPAGQITADAEVLTALGQPLLPEPGSAGGLEELAQELELADALVLAEAPPTDEEWVAETLHLLEELDEEPAAGPSDTAVPDEWLEELELLDEGELGASS